LPDLFRNPISKEERLMKYAYSIDLGIHPAITGGHKGSDDDPYPLQIAMTEGILLQEPESGRYTGFTPNAPASFAQIKAGDIIIFRVFNTTSICPNLGCSLVTVDSLTVKIYQYDGREADEPWKRESDRATIDKSPNHERSLTFTSKPREGMELPCHFERNSSKGIVAYEIMPATKWPVPYLFSVYVKATLTTGSKGTGTFYFHDDPEMVIGPDEDPPIGGPDQSPDIAAMSR
jgi:hypothetical protein